MSNSNESGTKEITSTANHIQLLQWTPEAFAGIDPTRNFVLYLNQAPIVGFEGDQGLGKTSLINCLIAHLGGDEAVNSIHVETNPEGKKTETRKSTLTFKDIRKPEITYEVRINKSAVSIKRIENADGTMLTTTVDKPKSFLFDMFGPIGISPMILKERDGKKQVEWIRSLYKFTADQIRQEQIMQTKYKDKFGKRTLVNNDLKRLKTEVSGTPYYKFDNEQKCFVPAEQLDIDTKFVAENNLDEDAINSKFAEATNRNRQLTEAQTRLRERKNEQETIQKQIDDLKRQLDLKVIELQTVNSKIQTGEQYVKELENAPAELETVRLQMQNAGDVKLKKQNLETAAKKVQEYQDKEDEQVKLNADLDELKIERKNFIKQFTPEIPGLELVINDGIDNEKEEGLYYHGRTPQQLSESELWDLFMQICRSVGIHFMFIENLNSLGSEAIDRINWYVNEGYGQVFYTAMQRGVKELKVTLHHQLQ